MTSIELLDIIGVGETSKVQFKREFDNQDKIAAEMIAFSNSKGGMLLFGVEDKSIKLGNAAVRNNLITSFCSKLMSYRGFGSGIIRAVESQPNIEMENDEKGEQFTIRVFRDENLESSEENVATQYLTLRVLARK
jgi:predicted HTH transcriptional regulator